MAQQHSQPYQPWADRPADLMERPLSRGILDQHQCQNAKHDSMHAHNPQIFDQDAVSVAGEPIDQDEPHSFPLASIENGYDAPIPLAPLIQPELKHPQPQHFLDNAPIYADMRYAHTPELTQHNSYASSIGDSDEASSFGSPYARPAALARPPTSMGREMPQPYPHPHDGRYRNSCVSLSEIHPPYNDGAHDETVSQYDGVVPSAYQSPYMSPYGSRAGTPDPMARTASPFQRPNRYPTPASVPDYPSLQRSYSDYTPPPPAFGMARSLSPFNKARPSIYRSESVSSLPKASPLRNARSSQSASSFPCPLAPYGCTSSFASKNEWKRHVNTQHLRLDMWRCDQCVDRNARHNDFNRKDLFIQHLRRMHPVPGMLNKAVKVDGKRARATTLEETDPLLVESERRCHIVIRSPPEASCCLFCPAHFSGPGSWEERMEHIGRHFEQNKKDCRAIPSVADWNHDEATEEWLESEGLIIPMGYGWQIADGRSVARSRTG